MVWSKKPSCLCWRGFLMWWKPWGVCVSFCFCKGKCTFSLVLQSHGGASDLTTRSEVVWRFSTTTLLQEYPSVLWEVSGAQCVARLGVQVFQCRGVFKSVCARQTEREEVCVNCTDCYFAAVPGERERKRKRIGGKQKKWIRVIPLLLSVLGVIHELNTSNQGSIYPWNPLPSSLPSRISPHPIPLMFSE